MLIGLQLRKLRDKRKLSQQEIADRLGVSQATYWNWENDAAHFKIEHLPKILEILDTDVANILPAEILRKIEIDTTKKTSVNEAADSDNYSLLKKLAISYEQTITLLKQENQFLKEENSTLKKEQH